MTVNVLTKDENVKRELVFCVQIIVESTSLFVYQRQNGNLFKTRNVSSFRNVLHKMNILCPQLRQIINLFCSKMFYVDFIQLETFFYLILNEFRHHFFYFTN